MEQIYFTKSQIKCLQINRHVLSRLNKQIHDATLPAGVMILVLSVLLVGALLTRESQSWILANGGGQASVRRHTGSRQPTQSLTESRAFSSALGQLERAKLGYGRRRLRNQRGSWSTVGMSLEKGSDVGEEAVGARR